MPAVRLQQRDGLARVEWVGTARLRLETGCERVGREGRSGPVSRDAVAPQVLIDDPGLVDELLQRLAEVQL
jgi:hypothetical protein